LLIGRDMNRETLLQHHDGRVQVDCSSMSFRRDYEPTELIADGVVHAVALGLATIGLIPLLGAAGRLASPVESASIWVYSAGLLTTLGLSAAYNLWPIGPRKWFLRRCDQSGIYVMIAATYTPFVVHGKIAMILDGFPIGLWAVAFAGVLTKFTFGARFGYRDVLPYLLFGWIGVFFYAPVWSSLPASAIWLIIAGGALYLLGVIFHLRQHWPYQSAIWHGFVVAAAACHYTAILECVSARAV
jgi:hemolysin III